MAFAKLSSWPDKQLRLVSTNRKKSRRRFATRDDMFETMYAAPASGSPRSRSRSPLRLITMDLASETRSREQPRPRVFINPEILSVVGGTVGLREGCLSIPEYYEEVERPAQVRVRFTDLDGKLHEEDAEGLFPLASSMRSIISTACWFVD